MEKKFKAFDRVLIKDNDGIWQIDFYSYQDSADLHHVMTYGESNSFEDEDILPYEGNEHLVGTEQISDVEIILREGEWVICFDNFCELKAKYLTISTLMKIIDSKIVVTTEMPFRFFLLLSDFNPNDMEETRRHILTVKNGKIVRYKG